MRYSIFILLAIILLSSCSNKFSLQKRRYSKGFYFATQSKTPSKKENQHASAVRREMVKEDVNAEVVNSLTKEPEVVPSEFSVHSTLPVTQKKQAFSDRKLLKHAKEQLVFNNSKFKKQIAETKQEIKKAKIDLFEIGRTMYIGYLAISLIMLVIFLFIELPFLEALMVVSLVLLGCLILYGIGSLFT